MANVHRLFDKKDDDEEDEGKQSFYTGGADNRGGGGSGMAVYGPPKDEDEDGSGGDGDVFDRLVSRATKDAQSMPIDAGDGEKEKRTITLYSNGFTVDDGPLREPNNPANEKFLAELLQGRVPSELRPQMQGGTLNVSLADKRGETYEAPAYVAFSGGATLGGSTSEASTDAVFSDDGTEAPTLDDKEPSTIVQVKAADGKKMRLKLNTSITVRQLAAAIRAQQAGSGPASFTLSAGFPPKDLTDAGVSLKDAGLTGAAIVQKSV
jgi:UBX domain-containing protein 1